MCLSEFNAPEINAETAQTQRTLRVRAAISKLNQLEFRPEASISAVGERAKLSAINIVLHVTRIPMVRNVED
jgi:hypothetical protein